MYKIIFLVTLFILKGEANKCVPANYGQDSVVCVCNSTYCDQPPSPEPPTGNAFHLYVSSQAGLRLEFSSGSFDATAASRILLAVNSNDTRQIIKGWGCAFTDSAGINIRKLSEPTQDRLMRQYFGEEGSRYSVCRIPVGGTDFSTRPYTLDDTWNDVTLSNFSLQYEDIHYKIPYIKAALRLNPKLKLFGSSWSAPPWMKTNGKVNGFGFLKAEYYQTYADYMLKFICAYADHDIPIWALTTGNEPLDAYFFWNKINTMGWTPRLLGKWITEKLVPTLRRSKFNNTVIMTLDDQRILLPWVVDLLFLNKDARREVDGIAVHMYTDDFAPASLLRKTHEHFPEKFMLMTEGCTGSRAWDYPKVSLGSWPRAEFYIQDIIENIDNWVSGWIDWNCALDKTGGPNWIQNYVDACIIVNPDTDEFYKQPMYYALTHVSKYVPPGSVVINITDNNNIKTMAFKVPTGETVIVLYNGSENAQYVSIHDANKDGFINLNVPAKSINTIIYRE